MKRLLITTAFVALASPALAQRAPDPNQTAQAVGALGRDTATGAACYIGTTATCAMPISASGGATGNTTLNGQNGTSTATTTNPVPVNNAQVSGTAVSTGTGATDAGTQRVVLGATQPSLTFTNSSFAIASGTNLIGGTIGVNAAPYTDASAVTFAANAAAQFYTIHATPGYASYYNAMFRSNVTTDTAIIQGCVDSACAVNFNVSATAMTTAGAVYQLHIPVIFQYYRTAVIPGTSAETALYIYSAFASN